MEVMKSERAEMEFMKSGDAVQIKLFDYESNSVMDAIEQTMQAV